MQPPRPEGLLRSFAASDPGPVRKGNEDYAFCDDSLGLYVVADGMGGHAAGEVASRLAVDSIENFVRRSQDSSDLSWPCGIDPGLTFDGNRLRTAIFLANRRVFRQAEAHDDYTGMGTTVVCALITGSTLAIGHVGDSRLYLLSGGELSQLTRDDTWGATLAASGEEASGGPGPGMHHVLTNVVGGREQTEIHIAERALRAGDTLFLCSDGVHNVLDVDALTDLLTSTRDPRACAEAAIALSIERRTRDNVTALVVQWGHEA